MATPIFHHLPGKEFKNFTKFLAMKVFCPAPGRTRNTLCAKDEGKIRVPAGEQAGHSISANALQGPGSWLRVLECLATHIFINPLHRVVARDECFSPALSSASAVFFQSPQHGGPMNRDAIALLNQSRQVPRVDCGILL